MSDKDSISWELNVGADVLGICRGICKYSGLQVWSVKEYSLLSRHHALFVPLHRSPHISAEAHGTPA